MKHTTTPSTLTLRTPLSHPFVQWLVLAGLVLSIVHVWYSTRRPMPHHHVPPQPKALSAAVPPPVHPQPLPGDTPKGGGKGKGKPGPVPQPA